MCLATHHRQQNKNNQIHWGALAAPTISPFLNSLENLKIESGIPMSILNETTSRSSQFWNGRAKRYEAAISNHDQQYDDRLAQLKQLIKPNDVILDFGCASGEIALDLAPHIKSIEGIDASTTMIQLAREKAEKKQLKNTSFLATDLFDARLEPQSFDVILALNIMHLLNEHDSVIHRTKELLKPGGMLFVETPCLDEFTWWKRKLILAASALRLAPFIHVYAFDEAQAELIAHNFQILGARNVVENDCRATIAARKPT